MNDGYKNCPVVLQTGFRIFFLGAAIYTVVSMAVWYFFYVAGGNVFVALPLTVWHGHEMIFGFTMAVVAGFLLTAVTNWTGRPTLSGMPLLCLFLIWLLARILAFMPGWFPLWPMALCNGMFIVFLTAAVLRPVVEVKQWRQSAVLSKIILIFLGAVVFYSALFHADLLTERKTLRFIVYMIVSLIFTISRRIMPFFTERGVGYPVTLRNSRFLDMVSLVFLVAFSVLDIFWPQRFMIVFLCAVLVGVHILRLGGWYTPGIWKKPLLWVLFLGYSFLITGFALKLFTVLARRPDDPALHAWTAGGIGLYTLGMMARVSWGHTGRSIAQPPGAALWMFILITLSAVVRVFCPIFDKTHCGIWIGISQILWIAAFTLFLICYFPVLTLPRVDDPRTD